MAKKAINERCPLHAECERKKCEHIGHELECPYYEANAREELIIEDQEEIRRERWRKADEEHFEQMLAELDAEDGEEDPREDHSSKASELVFLPVSRLHPHPDNPRKELGDLSELAESIKANGIYQNLTVVPDDPTSSFTSFTVIIGHRRHAAAKLAGLTEVPCVVTEMTPKEQIQTMLLENMQRSDLTVYEQAQGFQMMLDMGSTVEEIAEKSGFSKTTVRRRVKMMELDQETLKEVSGRQISLSDFDKLAQIENISARNKCLEKIGTADFNQSVTSQIRKQEIARKLPLVKKILKTANAKAITTTENYSSKYERVGPYIRIESWDENTPLIPPQIKGKVYYKLEESFGSLEFYAAREKAKPVKKSAAEIERQKSIDAAWAKAKELASVSYKMRMEFIGGISLNPKNSTTVLKGAISSIAFGAIDYSSADRPLMVKTMGITNEGYGPHRGQRINQAFEETSAKGYPMIVYSNFGDSENMSYANGIKTVWPVFESNPRLDALYNWLCSLGYVMSEEEKQFQSGAHELFKDSEKKEKKEEDPCAACKAAHPTCDQCCNACETPCNAGQACRKESEGQE